MIYHPTEPHIRHLLLVFVPTFSAILRVLLLMFRPRKLRCNWLVVHNLYCHRLCPTFVRFTLPVAPRASTLACRLVQGSA